MIMFSAPTHSYPQYLQVQSIAHLISTTDTRKRLTVNPQTDINKVAMVTSRQRPESVCLSTNMDMQMRRSPRETALADDMQTQPLISLLSLSVHVLVY